MKVVDLGQIYNFHQVCLEWKCGTKPTARLRSKNLRILRQLFHFVHFYSAFRKNFSTYEPEILSRFQNRSQIW